MNNLQFNFDEDSLYSSLSPDVVDISSASENGFLVEPGNAPQIEERFRAKPFGARCDVRLHRSRCSSVVPFQQCLGTPT